MIFPEEDGHQRENLEVGLGYLGREFQVPGRSLRPGLQGMGKDSGKAYPLTSQELSGEGHSWRKTRAGSSKGWRPRAGTPFTWIKTQDDLPNKVAIAPSP